jgi:hypothetical protein
MRMSIDSSYKEKKKHDRQSSTLLPPIKAKEVKRQKSQKEKGVSDFE